MKYIRKLQLILCAVHMYIIIQRKKTSNDKNKVFKEKKTVLKKLQKKSLYSSEFSKFVVLNSNFSLYINFFH